LLDGLGREGVSVIFARVSRYLQSDFERHGIAAVIGKTRIFATLHEAIAAARNGARLANATGRESEPRQNGFISPGGGPDFFN